MPDSPTGIEREELDGITIFLHAGLIVLGVLAWLTGEWAGDYKKVRHLGFTIHKFFGIGLSFFMILRIFYGFLDRNPSDLPTGCLITWRD